MAKGSGGTNYVNAYSLASDRPRAVKAHHRDTSSDRAGCGVDCRVTDAHLGDCYGWKRRIWVK
jgi:hypothetical protein